MFTRWAAACCVLCKILKECQWEASRAAQVSRDMEVRCKLGGMDLFAADDVDVDVIHTLATLHGR
jgi:hypothetical protein